MRNTMGCPIIINNLSKQTMSSWILSSSALAASAVFVATLLQQGPLVVDGARIKIHLAADSALYSATLGRLWPRQVPQSACSDRTRQDGSGLPPEILNNPEFNSDNIVQFYSSATAKEYIDTHVFTRKVSGLPSGQTVRDVFNMLFNESCYPFFFGGLVRDQFLGRMPGDVDVEVNCDVSAVYQTCVTNWGRENCVLNSGTNRAHIGQMINSPDDLLDFASTNVTFFAELSALEYTVNSLAYDLNGDNNIIVDLPGTGVDDVCSKVIRIPSVDGSQASWDAWRMAMGGRSKLYRFWKLRTKDLMPVDNETLQYIVEHTIVAIRDNPTSFKKFYCDTVYGHGNFNNVKNTCEVTQAMCTASAAKAESYKQRFREDFGDYYSSLETMMLEKCGKCTIK